MLLLFMVGNAYGQLASPERPAFVVPWKVVNSGEAPDEPLVLYWFPSSTDEMKSEEMLHSRLLTGFSRRCVAMQLVLPDDWPTIIKWKVTGKLPVALLASGGNVVARSNSEHGILRSAAVENMVHHELYLRSMALDRRLTEAETNVSRGDRDGAIRAYQQVWKHHCLAPEQGRLAERALRRLGIAVTSDGSGFAFRPIARR